MADSDPEPRKSYHHGNLRQALVEATLALIEEKGPLGFTLAEAARAAGVSPAAPYRHFRGREELIEEVARQGFVMFADRLERAADRRRGRRRSRRFSRPGGPISTSPARIPGYYHGDVRERRRGRRQPRARARRRPGAVGAGRRRRAARRAAAARAPAAADDGREPHLGARATASSSCSAAAGPAAGRPIRPRRCWRAARVDLSARARGDPGLSGGSADGEARAWRSCIGHWRPKAAPRASCPARARCPARRRRGPGCWRDHPRLGDGLHRRLGGDDRAAGAAARARGGARGAAVGGERLHAVPRGADPRRRRGRRPLRAAAAVPARHRRLRARLARLRAGARGRRADRGAGWCRGSARR